MRRKSCQIPALCRGCIVKLIVQFWAFMKKIIKAFFRFLKNKKYDASLTIIGVGPGDPSLLTLAAVDAIKKAKVIAYPISSEDKISYSAKIVDKYIKHKKKMPIIFPMARKEFNADEIWNYASEKIAKYIKNQNSVVLLCLGDISLFASSTNIYKIIKNNYPEIIIKTIPGISSVSAAAALSNFNLAKKGEKLLILECPDSKSNLANLISQSRDKRQVMVLMKVGKRWEWVKDFLKNEDILDKCLLALNLGLNDQIIENASKYKYDKVPYFSLLLIRL